MTDLDRTLQALAGEVSPFDVEAIDDAVLQGLASLRSERQAMRRTSIAVGMFALMTGVWMGGFTSQPAQAAAISPFGVSSALMPSSLLNPAP